MSYDNWINNLHKYVCVYIDDILCIIFINLVSEELMLIK